MRINADTYQALREIFSDVFMRNDIAINPSLTAADVAGWDSFKQIELIIAIERRFGIRLSSKRIDTLRCVGDFAAVIEKHA